MKKMNKKGFTMAELLIVVAIIAVLVAIAIPIFTAQLEKSREATDAANLRAAYAEVVASGITGEAKSITVKSTQTQAGWQSTIDKIGSFEVGDETGKVNAKTSGATWTVACDANGTATIN